MILSPTRELAQQTFREVLKLAYRTPILPALVYGGQDNFETQLASLKVRYLLTENMIKKGHTD